MNKVQLKSNLHVGSTELLRFQNFLNRNTQDLFYPLIESYGLLLQENFQGEIGDDWKLSKQTNFSVKINSGKAIVQDTNGEIVSLELTESYSISTPLVDGTYNVLLRNFNTNEESGSITLNANSNVVTGKDTKFTEYFAINRLLITKGQYYTVVSVNSDTEIIIDRNYTGITESGIPFSVGGWFTSPHVAPEDNNIYQRGVLQIALTTAEKGMYDYWIGEVTILGGIVISVTDKRRENIFRIYSEFKKITKNDLRERKKVIYIPTKANSGIVDSDISAIQPEILLSDNQVSDFSPKFGIRFRKDIDDKKLVVDFSAKYTDSGIALSDEDSVKYQLRIDIEGQANGNAVFLTYGICEYDISSLPVGFYNMYLKAKKNVTAFNCSIQINEIYLKGNYQVVVN
jgi:hypothetical protein